MQMKKMFFAALAGIVLAVPVIAQDSADFVKQLISGGAYGAPESVPSSVRINNLSEFVSKRPALPTVADLITPEAKLAYATSKALPYEKAAELFDFKSREDLQHAQNEVLRLGATQRQQQARQQSAMQQASAQGVVPSQQEIMQAMMSSGLNLETATEEQMMNVVADLYAKKWNISQADARTFMSMAMTNPKKAEAFLQQKYPDLYNKLSKYAPKAEDMMDTDPKGDAYGQLAEQLMDLGEEVRTWKDSQMDMGQHVQNVANVNADAGYGFSLPGLPSNKLERLYNQGFTWDASSECAKVIQMEDALVKRLENWMVNLNTNAEEVPYPQWWVDERKKENAIIDAWNKKQAELWIASFAEYDAKMKAFAQRLVQLDNQLEQTRGNGEKTLNYYMAKQQVYMVQMYFIDFYRACSNALYFPHVEHLEESGFYSPGMGGKG